jgi:uncharacterized protein (TIRG00374 family)
MMSLGSLLMVATWGLFAMRWHVLLASVSSVRPWDTFTHIMIGYLGNAMLPLRMGDVARIMLMSRKHQIDICITSATVVLERLLDVLAILALAAVVMLTVPLPAVIRRGAQLAALAALGVFGALALLARSQRAVPRLELFLSGRVHPRVSGFVFRILVRFAQGLQVAKSPRHTLNVSLLSLMSWVVASLSMWCYVSAFRLPVPWQAAALVLVVTNLGGAIPSSPGAIGVYEFLTMVALSVWLSDPNTAFGFAAAMHASNLALSVVLGLVAAWREGIQLSTLATGTLTAAENIAP